MKKTFSFCLLFIFILGQNNSIFAYSKPSILQEPTFTGGTTNIIYWKPGNGLDFQDVHRIPEDNSNQISKLAKQNSSGLISTPFENLKHGVKYGYYVLGMAGQDTVCSDTVYSIQDAVPPEYVGSTVGKEGPGLTIDLSWAPVTDDLSGVKGYVVYRNTGDGFSAIDTVFVDNILGDGSFFYHDTPGGLFEGRETYYIVAAFDSVMNIGEGSEIGPFIPDSTAPKTANFYWHDNYGFDYEYPFPDEKLIEFGYDYRTWYNKSEDNIVFVYNPNVVYRLANTDRADSVIFIAVRDSSKFFDEPVQPDILYFEKRLSIEEAKENASRYSNNASVADSLLAGKFDFSNGGKNPDWFINGHFYKYKVLFKDKSGNFSDSQRNFSRVFESAGEKHFVGAYQDLYPPERVSIVKVQENMIECNTKKQVQFFWKPGKDLISGLDKMFLNWVVDDDTNRFVFMNNSPDERDTTFNLNFPFPRALKVDYWFTSRDHVGNQTSDDEAERFQVFYNFGPEINYIDNIHVFNDSLRFKIIYRSQPDVSSFEICFADSPEYCEVKKTVQIGNPLINYTDEYDTAIVIVPIPSSLNEQFFIFCKAQFSDGNISLNSNLLQFRSDTVPPDPEMVFERVLNPVDVNFPIDSSFKDYPTICIDSVKTDVEKISIEHIVGDTSLNNFPICFTDSNAVPLLIYDYQISLSDTANNDTITMVKSGFGVKAPAFAIDTVVTDTSISEQNDTSFVLKIKYTLSYSIELKNKIRYEIRVFDSPFTGDPVPQKPPDKRGPGEEDDIRYTDTNVIINGEMILIPKIDGDYFLAATLHLTDKQRYTRAGVDSLEGFLAPHLQTPKLRLTDQPGYGEMYISWSFSDSDKKLKPNIFKVVRYLNSQIDTVDDIRNFYLDTYPATPLQKITYKIIPGYKFSKDYVYFNWDNTDSADCFDTRKAFIPFPTFPERDSTHYVPLQDNYRTVYFNDDSLEINWDWEKSSGELINNNCADVGQVLVQFAKDKTFKVSLDTIISFSGNFCSSANSMKEALTQIEQNLGIYIENGTKLFVRLTARDFSLENAFKHIWSDTLLAIYDHEKPAAPQKFNSYFSFATSPDSGSVDLLFFWKPVADRFSGFGNYTIKLIDLYQDVLLDTLYHGVDKNNDTLYWEPTKEKPDLEHLRIRKINIEHFLENKVAVVINYADKLNNAGVIELKKENDDFPLPIEMSNWHLTISNDTLFWPPISSEYSEVFDSYIVNYWYPKEALGLRGTVFHTTQDTFFKFPNDFDNPDISFHVAARFKYGSFTNWSGIVNYSKTSNGSSMYPILSDVTDDPNYMPDSYFLHQNYPNPFNPSTTIEYDLPQKDHVYIKIVDAYGREVRTLTNEDKMSGRYRLIWDGTDARLNLVSSGIYFIVMKTKYFQMIKKCIFLK